MSRDCKQFVPDRSLCLIGNFNSRPSPDDCASCSDYQGKDRGLGDKVSRVLESTGVARVARAWSPKGSCGCGKRRAALNKAFPSKEESDV
tara:strand:+ start:125 stop:394 length:270 start_codon:yes stop_codon:yes gene_type:complete